MKSYKFKSRKSVKNNNQVIMIWINYVFISKITKKTNILYFLKNSSHVISGDQSNS